MAWRHLVVTCEDAVALGLVEDPHEACSVIVCEDDATGDVAWHSHAPTEVLVEARLNPDYPEAEDWR